MDWATFWANFSQAHLVTLTIVAWTTAFLKQATDDTNRVLRNANFAYLCTGANAMIP
jgi:hypothetical protein